jgi:hypothetical protein
VSGRAIAAGEAESPARGRQADAEHFVPCALGNLLFDQPLDQVFTVHDISPVGVGLFLKGFTIALHTTPSESEVEEGTRVFQEILRWCLRRFASCEAAVI